MTNRRRLLEAEVRSIAVGDLVIPLAGPVDTDALLAEATDDAPYWAILWPSALALAEELAASELAGSRVLELACGLGLPSLAAATVGAAVTASDVVSGCLPYVQESARLSGLALETLVVDVAAPPSELREGEPFDVVIGSDLLYEGPLAHATTDLLVHVLGPGGTLLIAYPWPEQGPPLEARLLEGLAELDLTTVDRWVVGFRGEGRTRISVLRGVVPT